jgi:hypothetical protein
MKVLKVSWMRRIIVVLLGVGVSVIFHGSNVKNSEELIVNNE